MPAHLINGLIVYLMIYNVLILIDCKELIYFSDVHKYFNLSPSQVSCNKANKAVQNNQSLQFYVNSCLMCVIQIVLKRYCILIVTFHSYLANT